MPSAPPVPADAPAPDDLRSSRVLRYGVAGALVLYVAVMLVHVFGVPLFDPPDERAHVDYAWQVAHGELPVAGTTFTAEFPELGQTDYFQHVSNHPPLYYAITGPVLRLFDAIGHPTTGLYALRLVNVGFTLLTVLAIGRLAAIITARARREVRIATVIAACSIAAVNPALIAASGAIQNDALAVLLGTLLVTVLARAVRSGVDRGVLVQVAVLCTLGMLTRVTFLTVAAVGVAAVVALTLWPDLRLRVPGRDALLSAVRRAVAIGATIAAGAGWFLLLNLHRYGDLTGGSAVYGLESIKERTWAPGAEAGPLVYLLHPNSWWVQLRQLTAPPFANMKNNVGLTVLAIIVGLVLLAAVVAVLRGRARGIVDRPGTVTLLLLAVLFAGGMAKLALHVSNRGSSYQRYLLDALGLWAVGAALLVLALGRLAPHALAVIAGFGAVGSVAFAASIVLRADAINRGADPVTSRGFDVLRDTLTDSVVPGAAVLVVLAAAVGIAGLGLAVRSVAQAQRETAAAEPGTLRP